jgi:hypothetical protein
MRIMRGLLAMVFLSLTIFGTSCGESAPPTPLTLTEYVEWRSSIYDSFQAIESAAEGELKQALELAMSGDPSFWQVAEEAWETAAEGYKHVRTEWNAITPPPVFTEYHTCESYCIDETIRAYEMTARGAREHDSTVGLAGTDIMGEVIDAQLSCGILYKQICDAEGVELR